MSAPVAAQDLAIAGRLEPMSLELGTGQLVGLIGPNGSGKTSLLHALAGIPPGRGSLTIAGENPRGLHPDRRQRLFTFLPASRDISWPLAARDFINLALPPATDWAALAERFELGPLLDRRMDQLSMGERTRVMIARALAPDPLLLLLDEPIANLDPYWQLAILRELQNRAGAGGKIVVAAIHDLRAAMAWSDRLLLMDDRRCVADSPPTEMLDSGLIETIFRISLNGSGMKAIGPEGPQSSP
jgi:iron complex transport system ATP-binding protein